MESCVLKEKVGQTGTRLLIAVQKADVQQVQHSCGRDVGKLHLFNFCLPPFLSVQQRCKVRGGRETWHLTERSNAVAEESVISPQPPPPLPFESSPKG